MAGIVHFMTRGQYLHFFQDPLEINVFIDNITIIMTPNKPTRKLRVSVSYISERSLDVTVVI